MTRYGAFDQFGAGLPAVVEDFHRARVSGSGVEEAYAAMKAEVDARGGRWAVGLLVYTSGPTGIGIEQAPGTAAPVDWQAVADAAIGDAVRRRDECRETLAARRKTSAR